MTGSVAAVESVKIVRELRRHGSRVRVHLSRGAAKFIQPLALEWASQQPVWVDWSPEAHHLATGDLCLVAPCSSQFLQKISHGVCDSPTATLVQSYLGAKKPLVVIPCMHASLSEAPAFKEHRLKVEAWGVEFGTLIDEGKLKMPDAQELALRVAHRVNARCEEVLVAYGGAVAPLDPVRHIGNLSTGRLGREVCHLAFAYGFNVSAWVGYQAALPFECVHQLDTATYDQLQAAVKDHPAAFDYVFFATAVPDYMPAKVLDAKKSSQETTWQLELVATKKLVREMRARQRLIACKMSAQAPVDARRMLEASPHIHGVLANDYREIGGDHHAALITRTSERAARGKLNVARMVVEEFRR